MMKKMKIYVETYGCQMNEYDTELVRALLQDKDYSFTDSYEEADLVMLNTCSVRENANRKVYNRIYKIRHDHRNPDLKIGILGCMATNFKKELLDDKKLKIDFIAGPDSYKRLPDLLKKVTRNNSKEFDVTLSEFETYEDVYPARTPGVNGWIAVMRGCDNFCTFCVVPYTRGRERSRSLESIVEETRRMVDEGYKQVTLLGQNVNSYRHGDHDFADLLKAVAEVEGISRIRFTSPHPKDFPLQLLEIIGKYPNVCKQIHLPLQAGNNRILDLMNRTYTGEEYLALVEKIREIIPDVALSTDIIIGFPTETENDFMDTYRLVEEVQFDSAFIFKYSERQNTIASRKYPDDVCEEEKTDRIVRLNALQKKISLSINKGHIGEIQEVLVERKGTKKQPDYWQGRNEGNKLVLFPDSGNAAVGDFVKIKITSAGANTLQGKII